MNELIFTENNIEIIKEKSISYYKTINEIKDYEGYIKEYKSMIEYVENYFKVEEESQYIMKKLDVIQLQFTHYLIWIQVQTFAKNISSKKITTQE